MTNDELAEVFAEMADLLLLDAGDYFRARAFRRTADKLRLLPLPAAELLRTGKLKTVPDIGPGTTSRVRDLLRSGTCSDLQRLRSKVPTSLRELMRLKDVGPSRARLLYRTLGIDSLQKLQWAASQGMLIQVGGLPSGFSSRVLDALRDGELGKGSIPLARALTFGQSVIEHLSQEDSITRLEQTGSARRRKPTCGDLDILVASSQPHTVVEQFIRFPGFARVYSQGSGRASAKLADGPQFDLRVVRPEQYGAGLHYFTGSKRHNVAVRLRANERGLAISDHGVFTRDKARTLLTGSEENDIFRAVGLQYIPPTLRNGTVEIERAARGEIPTLIVESALKGDLGVLLSSLDDDAVAKATRGELQYICLQCDGTAFPTDDEQARFVHKVRNWTSRSSSKLLAGIRVPVRSDGSLGCSTERLGTFDWVVAVPSTAAADAKGMRDLVDAVCSQIDIHAWALADPQEGAAAEQSIDGLASSLLRHGLRLEVTPETALAEKQVRHLVERGVKLALASGSGSLRESLFCAQRSWSRVTDVANAKSWTEVIEGKRSESSAPLVPADGDFARELHSGSLSHRSRSRLERFVRGEQDIEVQETLAALSDNPLQAAYNLLMRTEVQVLPAEDDSSETSPKEKGTEPDGPEPDGPEDE